MKRLVLAVLLLAGAGALASSVAGSTAIEEIAAGRAALATHDLAAARQHFSTALTLEPTNQTAAALRGLTTWFGVINAPATQALLDRVGVDPAGRDLYAWTAQPTVDADHEPVVPADLNLAELGQYFHETLVPAGEAARADLARVTDPQFQLTLTPVETGSPFSITVDYADILTARAGLLGWEVLEHLLQGQNLSLDVHHFIELAEGNLLSLQAVLEANPDFLKAGSLAERQATVAALRDFAAVYAQASVAIRSRPSGLSRLFMLDPTDLATEAKFRVALDAVIRSLDGFIVNPGGPDQPLLHIGAAFAPDFSLRGLVPPIVEGGIDPFGPVDVSLGGLVAGLSREELLQIYGGIFGLNPGWTWLNPQPQGNTFTGYAYGNNRHVAVNAAGYVLTSANGTTWTLGRITGAERIKAIAFGNGMFVAVGTGGEFHSTDGVNWAPAGGAPDWIPFDLVLYAGGRFVALGSYASATSTDGVTWNWSYTSTYLNTRAIIYVPGQPGHFVAVGDMQGESRIIVSTDGVNWTSVQTVEGTLLGLASNGSRIVAVGAANLLVTSTDGTNWTTGTVSSGADASATDFRTVAWRNGVFVAAGVSNSGATPAGVAVRSTDGLAWTSATLPAGATDIRTLAAGPDAIIGLGAGGFIARSTDGSTFALASGGSGVMFTNLVAGKGRLNGLLVANNALFAYGAAGTLLKTTDGTTATALTSGTTADLLGGAVSGTKMVLAGKGGAIVTSTNGTSWTAATSGVSATLNAVRRCGTLFVAVGESATIVTSGDGTTWTKRSGEATSTLGVGPGSVSGPVTFYDVAYGNGKFLAVGGLRDDRYIDYGYYYPVVASSADGVVWSLAVVQNNVYSALRGIGFKDGQFVAADMEALHGSTDGVNWSWLDDSDLARNQLLSLGLAADGRWYATTGVNYGDNGDAATYPPAQLLCSSGGGHWWRLDLPVTTDVTDAEVFGGHVYVVAAHGGLLRANGTAGAIGAPTFTVSPQSQAAAEGSTVTLAARVVAEGPLTYVWKHDGTVVAGTTGPSLVLDNFMPEDAGDYLVTVTNPAGSVTSGTATLTIAGGAPLQTILWGGGWLAGELVRSVPMRIADHVAFASLGYSHGLYLKTDGTLWGMGSNASGQLGLGDQASASCAVQIASDVAAVRAAASHTFFLQTDGTLWASGENDLGQLGDGTTTARKTFAQMADDVAEVATSGDHTLILKRDGTLWAVGNNLYGQLGDGTQESRTSAVQIASDVAHVSSGSSHSLFVKTDQTLWAMGRNARGELGDGTTDLHATPVQVASDVIMAAAGAEFSMFLTSDGGLHAMGRNDDGQLGDGTKEERHSPVVIATGVTAVSTGSPGSFFVKADDSLWTVGGSAFTGAEDASTDRSVPRQVATNVAFVAGGTGDVLFVDHDGLLWGAGADSNSQLGDGVAPPAVVPLAQGAVKAAVGYGSALYVDAAGMLWRTMDGATTQIVTSGPVTAISVGAYDQTAGYLTSDQTLWSLDPNGASTQIATDVVACSAGFGYLAYVKADGTLWGVGGNGLIQFGNGSTPAQVDTGVTSVSAAGWHILYVKNDHTLWGMGTMWGGFGDTAVWGANVATPLQLETGITRAVANANLNVYERIDGSLWMRGNGWAYWVRPGPTWVASGVASFTTDGVSIYYSYGGGTWQVSGGGEIAGQVLDFAGGTDGSHVFVQTPGGSAPLLTALPHGQTVSSGSMVTLHGAAVGTQPMNYQWCKDGEPIPGADSYSDAWGESRYTIPYFTADDAGAYSLIVTNVQGTATTEAVMLALPSAPVLTASTPSQRVIPGNNATFRATVSGATSYQWERSVDGGQTWLALGDDDTFGGVTSAALTVHDVGPEMNGWMFRLVATNDLGGITTDAAPLSAAAYPDKPGFAWAEGGSDYDLPVHAPKAIMGEVAQVIAGGAHTLILKKDGTLWATGSNNNGQLGDGTTRDRSTPVQVATGVARAAASGAHSVFVKTDGTLWGMGANSGGRLGDGTHDNHASPVQMPGVTGVIAVAAGGQHTLFVKSDHSLWAIGLNAHGALGDGTVTDHDAPVQIATNVSKVAAPPYGGSSFFVKADGTLWAVGANDFGRLGDGTTTDRLSPVQIATGVVDVSAGANHTLFLKADGTVWGMGENDHGELGDGTKLNRSLPVQVGSGASGIAAANGRSFFLKSDHSLWGTGGTWNGGLVDPSIEAPELTTARKLTGGIAMVSAQGHTMLVATDGVLWAVGENSNGQLGDRQAPARPMLASDVVSVAAGTAGVNLLVGADGTLWRNNGVSSVQIAGAHDVVEASVGAYGQRLVYLQGDGTLWLLASDNTTTQVAGDVVSASAGLSYYVYLKSDGTLWGVGGLPNMIQLGDMKTPVQVASHVRAVSAAGWHFLFIKDDGTLWGQGYAWGGLVPGDVYQQSIDHPIQLETGVRAAVATSTQNLYLKDDGALWTRGPGWGPWTSGDPAMVDTDVVAFAAGVNATLYTKADGVLRQRSGVSGTLGEITEVAENVIGLWTGTEGWVAYLQPSGQGTPPTILAPPAGADARFGELVVLSVEAAGSGPLSYQWYKDDLPVSWARAATYPIPFATATDAGRYRVEITNSAGLVASDTATVTVNTPPTITALADQKINQGAATATLAFTVGDGQTASSALGVTAASSNATLVPAANVTLASSGANRTVKVTPAAGQHGSAVITLTVNDGALTASTSFTVTVNGVPTITAVANQSTKEDTATAALSFHVGDPETPASALTVTRASSDTALIPMANIVFGGSGTNRTVKVTPAPNKNGTATITLSVSDGALTAMTSFKVTVAAVNDLPTITKPADVVLAKGTNRTITFKVADTETSATALTVTRASSNPALVPTANLILGGSGANRTLKITPVTTRVGSAMITLTVADTSGGKTATTFKVTVANPPAIAAIADQSTNEDTSTVAIAVKISDADTSTAKLTLTAKSSDATLVPANGYTFGGSGANRTLKIKPGANQTGTATITLTVSDGLLTANRSFKLTVKPVNDAPTISAIANQKTNKNTATAAIAFKIGDVETATTKLTLTRTSSNPTLIPAANITLGGSGANRTVTIKPASNKTGSAKITLTVSDGALTASTSFTVTVNAPPTITTIANQTVVKNGATAALAFTIGDAETTATKLTLTKASSNTTFVPVANIVLGGTGANRTVKVTPAKNLTGSAKITLTVNDGSASASTSFTVTVAATAKQTDVTATEGPLIKTQPASQVVKAGAPVTLTVEATGAMSYRWTHDGQPLAGANTATLRLPAVKLSDAGAYAVTVTNAVAVATSRSAELTVVDAQMATTRQGSVLAVTQTLTVAGSAKARSLSLLLPAGWSYRGGTTADAAKAPQPDDTDLIEWSWPAAATKPALTFTYVLALPDTAALPQTLDSVLSVDGALLPLALPVR